MRTSAPGRAWLDSLGSVRARTTAVAAVAVCLALALGALTLLLTVRTTLERSGDTTALARARDVAALAADGSLPTELTLASEDEVIQVLDADGRVVSATPNAAGPSPLIAFDVGGSGPEVRTVSLTELD